MLVSQRVIFFVLFLLLFHPLSLPLSPLLFFAASVVVAISGCRSLSCRVLSFCCGCRWCSMLLLLMLIIPSLNYITT